MSLLPSEQAQYTAIIDKILESSDLEKISAKAIRKGLAAELGIDVTDKKEAIQALILERFDRAQGQESDPNPIPTIEAVPATNGVNKVKKEAKVKSETPASRSISATTPPTPTDDDHDSEPPKKKIKKSNGNSKEMNDADLAAMLQAQENSRGRATRGGGVKKAKVVKKKTPKKKSAAKIKVDDDSDVELNSDGEVKEKPKKGGFHKQYQLSESLADMVGANALSRPQVVKKIWEYVRAHELQNPSDKRQIICDEKMERVFKTDKVHMFTMNKLLGKHLYDIDETV